MMNRRRASLLFAAICALVVVGDLWSKGAVFDFLGVTVVQPEGHEDGDLRPYIPPPIPERQIFDGFFSLQPTLNYGAFNGMFAGMRPLLLGVSALWAAGAFAFVLARRRSEALLVTALALTAGGALGNLYDRLVFGAVRDFVKWYVRISGEEYVWPNFNIADSCICVGVGLILVREYVLARAARATPEVVDAAAARSAASGEAARPVAGARDTDREPSRGPEA